MLDSRAAGPIAAGVLPDWSVGSAVVQPVNMRCDYKAALTIVKHPCWSKEVEVSPTIRVSRCI